MGKFFMCKKMVMKECCVKQELKKWTEYLYGEMEPAKLKELGLPLTPTMPPSPSGKSWTKWRSLPRNMSSNSFSACNFSETQKTFIVTKQSHEPMLSKSYR